MLNVTLKITKAILVAGVSAVAGNAVKNATCTAMKDGFISIKNMNVNEFLK